MSIGKHGAVNAALFAIRILLVNEYNKDDLDWIDKASGREGNRK